MLQNNLPLSEQQEQFVSHKSALQYLTTLKTAFEHAIPNAIASTLEGLRVPDSQILAKQLLEEIKVVQPLEATLASEPKKQRIKMRDQEKSILDAIKKLGYDPIALPKNVHCRSGVKSQVREMVQCKPLFINTGVFDKAWERLRKGKEIIDMK